MFIGWVFLCKLAEVEEKKIEIYSELVDNAVVRMPDRRVLGSVMQGDTLFLMHADLIDILESHKHDPDTELFFRIFQIAQSIEERLLHYIDVCEKNGIELGFSMEFSVEDYKDLV